jgi:hypothetical protein
VRCGYYFFTGGKISDGAVGVLTYNVGNVCNIQPVPVSLFNICLDARFYAGDLEIPLESSNARVADSGIGPTNHANNSWADDHDVLNVSNG